MIGWHETFKSLSRFHWEPSLASIFATTISPWNVTTDALGPFQITSHTPNRPVPHTYLRDPTTIMNTENHGGSYDNLTVAIQPQPEQEDEAASVDRIPTTKSLV